MPTKFRASAAKPCKVVLRVTELEARDTPAWWSVTAPVPPEGTLGSTDATHTGNLTLNPDYSPFGGAIDVWADTAGEAVTRGLIGTITVTLGGVSIDQVFSPSTVGVPADGRAFALSVSGSQVSVSLEDMVGFPGVTPDMDYNDRTFGGGGVSSISDPTVPIGLPDTWLWENPSSHESATVHLDVTRPDADKFRWRYTVTNNSLTTLFNSPGINQFEVVPGDASDVSNMKTSMAGWMMAVNSSGEVYWRVPCMTAGPYLAIGATATFTFDTPPQPVSDASGGVSVAGIDGGGGSTASAVFQGDGDCNCGDEMVAASMGPDVCVAVDDAAGGVTRGPGLRPIVNLAISQDYIPVNANNTNYNPALAPNSKQWESLDLQYIPAIRDFDARSLWQDDPEIIPATVEVYTRRNAGVVTIDIAGLKGLQIWEDRRKITPFTSRTLSGANPVDRFTVYLEGVEPSRNLRDIAVITKFKTLIGAITFTDTDLTTVTPVLQLLSVSLLPTISFVAPPAPDQNGNLGNDGRRGVMSGRRAAANLPAKNAFELNGEVITEGIRSARVVQTLDIDSGHHGTGGTYIDVNGVQYKYGIDPNDLTLVTPSGMRSSFPLVDGATSASAPFYDNSTTSALQPGRNPGDPPFRNLRAVDSPGLIIGDILFGESVTSIDALFSFKVYVVAEYDDKSIYTIAAYDWRANFYATTRVAGRGVTVIQADSMVTGDSGPRRSHLDPDITTGKTVSEAVSVI